MRSQDVLNQQFRVTTLTTGYDPEEVDRFLDLAAQSLQRYESGAADAPLSATTIDQVTFAPTRNRNGYHQQDVDLFLDELSTEIAACERDPQRLQHAS